MMPSVNPTHTKAWAKLEEHFLNTKEIELKTLFDEDKDRFQNFLQVFESILVDYSKNRITSETLSLLLNLAEECHLKEAIKAFYSGELINKTEKRAVLHMALRAPDDDSFGIDGISVTKDVHRVLSQMQGFSNKVIDGEWKGYTGKAIKTVVNIGIGGSDLGPKMVVEALKPYANHLDIHFVSNVDDAHLKETLKLCDAESTLFIIASKTFTTQETMTNANSARVWFLTFAKEDIHVTKHFVALSTNAAGVEAFGINKENRFEFWDWVGGRYSLWSAIGLSICLAVGFDNFKDLLNGAHTMDNHFRNEDFESNIPVLLALLGIWYNNFYKAESHAVLPYDQNLEHLPAYLQQADMESSGKSIDRNGEVIHYETGPIIWGEAGTNGQHAFYQLIHQGTKLIPSDFLVAVNGQDELGDHHLKLSANFFAQTEALAFGKSEEEVVQELKGQGLSLDEIQQLKPYKVFKGNIPTNSIIYKKLNPKTLGQILALYEHKIFVQGVLWNIFSFDQWGVELGKQLAKAILPELVDSGVVDTHDSSTNHLINYFKENRIG